MPRSSTKIRFGTDGWRAAIAQEFTFSAVRRLAYGFAMYIRNDPSRENRAIVGYDRRFASEHFAAAAADMIAHEGIAVELSDRAIPTQLCSFMAQDRKCMAFVVTASHNEWLDNGIKIKDVTGAPAEDHILRSIEALVPARAPITGVSDSGISKYDMTKGYLDRVRGLVDIDRISSHFGKFVIDSMHGCAAGWLPMLVDHTRSFQFTEIRTERNPYFGGVNPEPIMPHLEALRRAVIESSADGGLAFDGDADRVGLITESGRFVNQLQVFALLYLHLLADRDLRHPAVHTVTSTQMIPRIARAFGTEAHETSVGFKYVGSKMREVGAVIGGEESGGFGYGFHIPERDGLLSALLLLELRAMRGLGFDALLSELQERFGPSEYNRVDVHYDRHAYVKVIGDTLKDIDERIGAALHPLDVERVVTLPDNGVKAYLKGGSWLMLRFSGTEPVLRIYAEGPSASNVADLLERGRGLAL